MSATCVRVLLGSVLELEAEERARSFEGGVSLDAGKNVKCDTNLMKLKYTPVAL